ncbi:NAD(P)H-dependent flavin oxidoreductase [Streptomyces sp. CA-100214]
MNASVTGEASRLPAPITSRLRLPVIAAPMLRISGPDLVAAACRAGAIGSFPVRNARGADNLAKWLVEIDQKLADLDGAAAPVCPNLIMRSENLQDEVDALVRHGVEMVITSVGSPKPVLGKLHDAGVLVLADVATIAHARKAVEAGVDGLILLVAGAGGQTGWMNPFAFVRGVREFFDGPLVMAGG